MKPIKSGTSYFRRALKIKGRTEHSGRGFYELEYDCSKKELQTRIDNLVNKFPERFNVERSGYGIKVQIKPELMAEPYYYTLYLSDDRGLLSIGM